MNGSIDAMFFTHISGAEMSIFAITAAISLILFSGLRIGFEDVFHKHIMLAGAGKTNNQTHSNKNKHFVSFRYFMTVQNVQFFCN